MEKKARRMKSSYRDIAVMMMCIMFVPFVIHAQTAAKAPATVSGKVFDKARHPVGFATVTLLKASDSSLVKGTITDEAGRYDFTAEPGVYRVAASATGMVERFSDTFGAGEGAKIVVPDLVMEPDVQTLQGIQITARKPFIEQQIDRTVVNVENSVVSAGNTALELLEKLPGITVDNDGNISLKGKAGVTIMIDGKPTYLSQQQVVDMLRSMSADQLSQVEIITNPSAKYDAAGTAGIINIKLKKNTSEGMNGSISIGHSQGVHGRENGNLNLNYRKGKINLFGNYSASGGATGSVFRLTRKFFPTADDKTPDVIMTQQSPRTSSWNYQGFKAGLDYRLDEKNTLGVMVNTGFSHSRTNNGGPLNFFDGNNQLDSVSVAQGNNRDSWHSATYNINYRLLADTSGQELTANIDYSVFGSGSDQHFSTAYLDAHHNEIRDTRHRRGNLPSGITIRSAKVDYVLPLNKKTKLEAGLKSSLVTTDNDMQFENEVGDSWETDVDATNHFIYKENINAAYVNFSKEFKKGWAVQLGLRGEQTTSDANQITIDSTVKRDYLQLFPSTFVKKTLDKNNSLTVSYSRRIDRPDYHDLNPFRYYIDDYTYGEGNPFLEPQFTNAFELAHSFKGMLTTTVSYSHTSDVMADVIRQDDQTHVNYETKDNLNTRNNMGVSVSTAIKVTKWWTSNNFVNVYRNQYKGQLNGGAFDQGVTSFSMNTTNTFILPWEMKAEVSGYYNSKSVYSVWIGYPTYSVSAGIQKDLWNKKANLKLNVNDVFNTQHSTAVMKYENIDLKVHNTWESRNVGLTFSYRFGNKNLKTTQPHQSGIEEEQRRINK